MESALDVPLAERLPAIVMSVARSRNGPPRRAGRVLLGMLVAATITSVACAARTASAETTFALDWHAEANTPTCVRGAAVRQAVEDTLGRRLFVDRATADIVFDGEEHRDGKRHRARVVQRDRAGAELGTRELEAETCAALERMTVVVVTLFIEPGDRDRATPTPAPPRSDDPPAGEPAAVPRRAPRQGAHDSPAAPVFHPSRHIRRSGSARLALGVGGGAALGLLPGPSASIRGMMRLAILRSRFSFDWSLGYSLPQTVTDGWVRATFSAIDQQLRACFTTARAGVLHIDGCAGGVFSAVLPSTRGIEGGDESARTLLSPTAALAARIAPEGPGALHLELGLAVPWRQRSQSYVTWSGEARTLYSSSPVIGLASVTGTFALF